MNLLLADDDSSSVILNQIPYIKTASTAPITELATDDSATNVATANSVNKLTGALTSIKLPAQAGNAENDTVMFSNQTSHAVKIDTNPTSGTGVTTKTLNAGGIGIFRFSAGDWAAA